MSADNPLQASPSKQTSKNPTEISDVLEERLIDAEYKIWKKNTPYLYDLVMTHSLEWPSLTCQWLPSVKMGSAGVEEHSLVLGTHTTGEQNYLMIANVCLPKSDAQKVVSEGQSATTPVASYDEERNEVGGFGFHASGSQNPSAGRIEIRMKVKHQGEVNRARYMPQNHFIIASRGPAAEIYLFDLSKHPSFPEENGEFCPQCVLAGHEKEGYGLSWSALETGKLVSSGEDGFVCLWDVNEGVSGGAKRLGPVDKFIGHKDVVEDVAWHAKDPHLIGSVGDDRCIMLWDIRKKGVEGATHEIKDAHDADINSIAFNPVNEFLFATGSADKTVALWDIRNLKSKIKTFTGHTDQVFQVVWAPHNESILTSCSADRRVNVWDLSRIGEEQNAEDAEDGPPELLFMHGGHTSKVSDFSWNTNDEWTLASVSEDNVLQVWNMAEEIYVDEDDESIEEAEGKPGKAGKVLGDDELEGL